MRLELMIWAIRQLDPRTLRRKLRWLLVALGALGWFWGRSVNRADVADEHRRASHMRRARQARERVARYERPMLP